MIWFGLLEAAENLFRETVVLPSGWVHQSKKEKWKFLATFYITDLREYYYIWNLICVPLMICLYTFWWPIELMLGDDIWNGTAKITTRPLGNVILKLISELSSMQNVRSILLPCLTIFSNVFIVDVDARPKNTSFVSFTSWSYHYDQLCSRTAYMPASPARLNSWALSFWKPQHFIRDFYPVSCNPCSLPGYAIGIHRYSLHIGPDYQLIRSWSWEALQEGLAPFVG